MTPRPNSGLAAVPTACAWLLVSSCHLCGADLPSDWRYDQTFTVAAAGLTKLSLPLPTLDAARPALEDVRLYDEAGTEVPYVIDRPAFASRLVQTVKSFQVSLEGRNTVMTIATGLTQPLDTLVLETPATQFLKPVQVEGSADGRDWKVLARGQPIFRMLTGASQLQVSFSAGVWAWLRLTVDDQRDAPIPFTGARVHAVVVESAPSVPTPVAISERHENPGETRLTLDLGAANLNIASVQFELAAPLFLRPVTFAVPEVTEDAVREQPIGQGTLYRVAIEGQPASERLSVPLERVVRARELLAFIKNQDSPPLPITSVRIERRPVYLVFLAGRPGVYHLLMGNPRCGPPGYDLAALGMDLKSVPILDVALPPPKENPGYHPPEVLPGVAGRSAALDVADWRFRKPVKLARSGAQQLEPDLEVLAQAQPSLGDLRLMRGGTQIPYILEHTSIRRAVTPSVTVTNDVKDPKLSRWILKLPQPGLPLEKLTCAARTTLFERELTLYEEIADERGEKYRRNLGEATWIRRPDQVQVEWTLAIQGAVNSDTLFLETRNGDNSPIELEHLQVVYPVSRVLFKANSTDELVLYYGNPRATPPRYDLSLVADQLLAADKSTALLSAAETLKPAGRGGGGAYGQGGILFWSILAVVVVVLLLIIARLLPKAPLP